MTRDNTGANVKSTALVPDRLLCGNDNLRGSAPRHDMTKIENEESPGILAAATVTAGDINRGACADPVAGETTAGAVTFQVAGFTRKSKLFRTGIDDLPEIFAVLDLLHFGGQAAVAADPVLHRIGIIGHQVRCPLGAGDLDAEGKGLVVIRLGGNA